MDFFFDGAAGASTVSTFARPPTPGGFAIGDVARGVAATLVEVVAAEATRAAGAGATAVERCESGTMALGSRRIGCLHSGFGQRILRPRYLSSTRNRKLHDVQQKDRFIALDPACRVSFKIARRQRKEINASDGGKVNGYLFR